LNFGLDVFRFSDRLAALTCFVLFVVPLVAYCAWRVPLGQVPDEPAHIARVGSVLRGEIIGYRLKSSNPLTGAPDAGVTGNYGLALASIAGNGETAPLPASASAKARLTWVKAIPWSPTPMFISSVNTAAYAPVAYIPAAVALGIAIEAGVRPHNAAIAARFGNVVAFAALGCLALLLAGRGRLLMLVTLGLPTTIWLAGSCNQDGTLIAAAVLAIALLTRCDRTSFWIGTVLLAVLALQKPPFAALMLLPLIAPAAAAVTWTTRVAAALLVIMPAMLWSILVIQHVTVPLLPSAPYHPGPLWPGDPHRIFRSAIAQAQLQVILRHPFRLTLQPLINKIPGFPTIWTQMIGTLGPFTIEVPESVRLPFILALLSSAAALLSGAQPSGQRRWTFLLALLALSTCAELIYMVEYLTWTPVGCSIIEGVQGRYFLPLLPVLTLILGRLIPLSERFGWIWWITPVFALILLNFQLPSIIAQHYYR